MKKFYGLALTIHDTTTCCGVRELGDFTYLEEDQEDHDYDISDFEDYLPGSHTGGYGANTRYFVSTTKEDLRDQLVSFFTTMPPCSEATQSYVLWVAQGRADGTWGAGELIRKVLRSKAVPNAKRFSKGINPNSRNLIEGYVVEFNQQ